MIVDRNIKVFFFSRSCFLDNSSGAVVASRAMLKKLVLSGFSVTVITDHVFEKNVIISLQNIAKKLGARCELALEESWKFSETGLAISLPPHYRINLQGIDLFIPYSPHTLQYVDSRNNSNFYRLCESSLLFNTPDILFCFGSDYESLQLQKFCKDLQIPVVFFLHNTSYSTTAIFQYADIVTVPLFFARDYYKKSLGLDCVVMPNIIDNTCVFTHLRDPKYLLFVNPSSEKGVFLFARLADMLGHSRPDIPILVVESRGTERTLADCGLDLACYGNLFLMSNTTSPIDYL